MRLSWRTVSIVVLMVGITAGFKGCDDEDTSGGEDPPTTVDDILQVTGAAATSLAVLSNDTDLDNEPLTVTIDDSPTVGSASINTDNTVRLDLPSGFRGVTRFKYKVTNSLGGFSISSAVVYVDVPAYRTLFAAKGTAGNYELYVSNLISADQVSQATSGNFRLRTLWRSESGALIVYERADPNSASTSELYMVKTTPVASPVKINVPGSRNVVSGGTVAISDDNRYIAFATSPASTGGQPTNLYVQDATSSNSPTAVDQSANVTAALTQWAGETSPSLYFLSAPSSTTTSAVYRATPGSLDTATRVSPNYNASNTTNQIKVSPDQTRLLLVGTHNGQTGVFFIDPTDPNTERRLTTDIPAGGTLESFEVSEDFTKLVYLWRSGSATNARLSTVQIVSGATPTTVLETDITSFSDLRPDGLAAIITRGSGGRNAEGTAWEVSLDRSTSDVRIANNVGGGVYDDSGDRVYLFGSNLTPSVIARSNFGDNASALVRTSTSSSALYVTPLTARSAAIIEDATSGVVLVNAAAPGKTLRLTNLDIGSIPSNTLLPAAIPPAP
jgi:Big-like domain-containing protein